MAEFPVLPLYTDAYLGDTTHLTTIEHGAYLLLLITAWRSRGCALPDDDRLLARYTRLSRAQWLRVKPVLKPFFVAKDGQWIQSRLTDEYLHVRQVRDAQIANGRASALKRKARHAAERGDSDQQSDYASDQRTGDGTSTPSISTLEEEGSVANATARRDAPFDPVKLMFDSGVLLLGDAGFGEERARGLIGKWRGRHGVEAVLVALGKAFREGASEPVSFIEACLKKANDNGRNGNRSYRDPILGDAFEELHSRVAQSGRS